MIMEYAQGGELFDMICRDMVSNDDLNAFNNLIFYFVD